MQRPFLLVLTLLAGCAPGGAEVSAAARQSLIGMKSDDLQACAGIPTRTKRLEDGSELLSYEQKNPNVGGLDLTLPMVGGFSLAGSGSYCTALFRMAQGRVIGLNYTGDNDDRFGEEGVCAPIVRGCLRNPHPALVPPAMPVPLLAPAASFPQASPPPASSAGAPPSPPPSLPASLPQASPPPAAPVPPPRS
jgi:hypothetical protein